MAGFEIVIIGSGVAGGSTAYHAARQGRKVLVIERATPATEPAASWASAGGVRRQGRHPAEALLAIEAIDRWPSLEEELGADMGYQQGGNLKVAEGDAEAEELAAFVKEQQAMGFVDVRLVVGKELREIAPALSETVTAGSYSAKDGQADPPLTTRAYASAAQRAGATYWNDTETLSMILEGSRVVGVKTSKGEVRADAVVLSAGCWSDTLARTIGISLPIRTRAPQMLLSSPAPIGTLRPVLGTTGRRLSLKQLRGGEFMLGGGWPGIMSDDRRAYTLQDDSIAGNWAAAVGIIPAVGEQRIIRRWCGLEAECFDKIPLVGPWPGIDGLILACGFSGHGFAISPAVGRAVADKIAGTPTPELDGLDPSRIAAYDAKEVEAYVNDNSPASMAVG